MAMKLEVLPARKGDCMLVHFDKEEGQSGLILVDGGPAGVWNDSLKSRLVQLREERSPGRKLFIDIVVVSHVDDDHINGILRLLKEMDDDEFPVEIGEIWHNSFDRVIGNDQTARMNLSNPVLASIGSNAAELKFEDDEDKGALRDTAKVLASVKQGDDLQRLAKKLNIPINLTFNNALIVKENISGPIILGELTITVFGPLRNDLQKLQKVFDKWLVKQMAKKTEGSLLAALADKSKANLSSIVLLIDDGERTLLLTGDARSDKILTGLGKGNHEFNILKFMHHGSDNNVDQEFFERVKADTYVFSGDGEHGNPERATIEMLISNAQNSPKLVFTYPLDEIDTERKHEYEKWRIKRGRKGKTEPVWKDETQALRTLLDGSNATVISIQPDEESVVL